MSDINTNMQIAGSYKAMIGEPPTVEEAKGVKPRAADKGIDITCAAKSGPAVSVSIPELAAPKIGAAVDAPALLGKMRDVSKPFTTMLGSPAGGPKLGAPAGGLPPSGHTLMSVYAIIQLLFEAGVELRKAAWAGKNASDMQQVSTILGQAEQQRQNALTGVSVSLASMGLQVVAMAAPAAIQAYSSSKADAAKSAYGAETYKQMVENTKLEGNLQGTSDAAVKAGKGLDKQIQALNGEGVELGFGKSDVENAVSGFQDGPESGKGLGDVRLQKQDIETLKSDLDGDRGLRAQLADKQTELAQLRGENGSPQRIQKLEGEVRTLEDKIAIKEAQIKTGEAALELKDASAGLKKASAELKKASEELNKASVEPNKATEDLKNPNGDAQQKAQAAVEGAQGKFDTALEKYNAAVESGRDVIKGRFEVSRDAYLKQLGEENSCHGIQMFGHHEGKLTGAVWGRYELGMNRDKMTALEHSLSYADALKAKEFSKSVDLGEGGTQNLRTADQMKMDLLNVREERRAAINEAADNPIFAKYGESAQTARTWRDALTTALRPLDAIIQYGVHSMEADVTARGAHAKMEEIKSDTSKRMLDDAVQLCQRAIQLYDMAQQSELSVIQKVVA